MQVVPVPLPVPVNNPVPVAGPPVMIPVPNPVPVQIRVPYAVAGPPVAVPVPNPVPIGVPVPQPMPGPPIVIHHHHYHPGYGVWRAHARKCVRGYACAQVHACRWVWRVSWRLPERGSILTTFRGMPMADAKG